MESQLNNEQANNEKLEAERLLNEEEMKRQEREDDADLKRLKDKLRKLEEKQPPNR